MITDLINPTNIALAHFGSQPTASNTILLLTVDIFTDDSYVASVGYRNRITDLGDGLPSQI